MIWNDGDHLARYRWDDQHITHYNSQLQEAKLVNLSKSESEEVKASLKETMKSFCQSIFYANKLTESLYK